MSDLLRIYEPSECGKDGYPLAWHKCPECEGRGGGYNGEEGTEWECEACLRSGSVKGLVRVESAHRCVRCHHPYYGSEGEWSSCDEHCHHRGPVRLSYTAEDGSPVVAHEHRLATEAGVVVGYGKRVEAQWRVLTVHHLTGVKADLRWWNLAALCQRCHLEIQGRVRMEQVYPHEHSPWFKPYAAGYYAASYLAEDLTREQTEERLDELLALELAA